MPSKDRMACDELDTKKCDNCSIHHILIPILKIYILILSDTFPKMKSHKKRGWGWLEKSIVAV